MNFNIRDNINDLLSKIDIVEVISEFISLKRSSNNYVANCPFHNDKTPSFYINVEKKYYHCFGCLSHGDVIQFIINYKNMSFFESINFLCDKIGYNIQIKNKFFYDDSLNLYKSMYLFLNCVEFFVYNLKLYAHSIIYLYNRGLSDHVIDLFKLGFFPSYNDSINFFKLKNINFGQLKIIGLVSNKNNSFMFCNRIIFPIRNFKGDFVGFGGRVVNNPSSYKYINSPETFYFKKKKEFYGIWEFLLSGYSKNIIIVEGYFDVLSLVQNDIKNVVSVLGTCVSKEHIEFLFIKTKEIIFCFDGDIAGRKAVERVLDIALFYLDNNRKINIVSLDESYDPDRYIREFGRIKFLDKIYKSKNFFDYYIFLLSEKYNLYNENDKFVFEREIKKIFSKLSNDFLKKSFYISFINLYNFHSFFFIKEFEKNFKNFFHLNNVVNFNSINFLFIILICLLIYNRNFLNYFFNVDLLIKINVTGSLFLYELINILLKDKYLCFDLLCNNLSVNCFEYLKNNNFIYIFDSIPKFFVKDIFFESINLIKNFFNEKEVDNFNLKDKIKNSKLYDNFNLFNLLVY